MAQRNLGRVMVRQISGTSESRTLLWMAQWLGWTQNGGREIIQDHQEAFVRNGRTRKKRPAEKLADSVHLLNPTDKGDAYNKALTIIAEGLPEISIEEAREFGPTVRTESDQLAREVAEILFPPVATE